MGLSCRASGCFLLHQQQSGEIRHFKIMQISSPFQNFPLDLVCIAIFARDKLYNDGCREIAKLQALHMEAPPFTPVCLLIISRVHASFFFPFSSLSLFSFLFVLMLSHLASGSPFCLTSLFVTRPQV